MHKTPHILGNSDFVALTIQGEQGAQIIVVPELVEFLMSALDKVALQFTFSKHLIIRLKGNNCGIEHLIINFKQLEYCISVANCVLIVFLFRFVMFL